MTYREIVYKIEKVFKSCVTKEQIKTAENYCNLLINKDNHDKHFKILKVSKILKLCIKINKDNQLIKIKGK